MNWTVMAIIIAYFIGMFVLGIIANRKTKNVSDYYVAGRGVGGIFTAFVYMTSLVSAGALVGWTSQAATWGMYFIYAACAVTLATFLCWWLLGRRVMRISREQGMVTIPDFVEARFESKAARLIASVVLIVFSIPLIVSQFKAAGLLFNMVTGVSYNTAIIVFGIIMFLYVAFGGYFAVIYTDAAQGFLMLFGIMVLLVSAFFAVGGLPGEQYALLNPDGAGSWPVEGSATNGVFLIAFVLLTFFGGFGAPNYIRGFYAMKNVKAFKRGFTIIISVVVFLEVIIVLLGLYGGVLFPNLDDPDLTVFNMIETLLSPIMAGVVLSALAAAMMSTMDSLLIQCASTVENDILTKTFNMRMSEKTRVLVARITVAVIGIICVIWGLNPPKMLSLLMYPAWGVMGLSFAYVFYVGLFWKRFNKAGVIAALLSVSVVFTVWNILGNPLGIYHIQMALLVSIPVSIIATLLTPKTSKATLEKFFRR